MSPFVTGLLFGFVGSAHCAAMCGPLVVTIGRALARPSRRARVLHAVEYHGARVAVYAALGLGGGAAGQTLATLGLGRVLAVAAGLVLLLLAFGPAMPNWWRRVAARPASMVARACAASAAAARSHPGSGALLAGAANGLLPCGLVYAALLTATAIGSASGAVALMAGFGLGTAPVLLTFSWATSPAAFGLRLRLRRLQPVLLAVTAVILLARGLAPESFHAAPSVAHSAHRHP